MSVRKREHYHHKNSKTYSIVSPFRKVFLIFGYPLLFVFVLFFLVAGFKVSHSGSETIHFVQLFEALGASFLRLFVAYFLSIIIGLPLAFLVVKNKRIETLLLPIYDIIESVPILVFFPIILVVFSKWNMFNGAAIFILFFNMLWNIVFNVIGGLKVIPSEIKSTAKIFGVKGFAYMRRILIPSVMPEIITGTLLAFAEGWNMLIVAEVIHTYIPGSNPGQDLFGIGSILVNAGARNETQTFFVAIILIILAIAFINLFVWQKLLKYGERFRFE